MIVAFPWYLHIYITMNPRCNDILRKDAYSNILKISPPKSGSFQIKKPDIFHISAQNIDCGYSLEPPRRGGSNEYPQSMFLSNNKKNNIYLCEQQFYYIKVGFKGVKIIYCIPRYVAIKMNLLLLGILKRRSIIYKKGLVLFLLLHRTYVLDNC